MALPTPIDFTHSAHSRRCGCLIDAIRSRWEQPRSDITRWAYLGSGHAQCCYRCDAIM